MSKAAIEHGVVEVNGNRVGRVGTAADFGELGEAVVDYGDAIIVPGLINLHTHLDYSHLPLLDTRSALFEWIPQLMNKVKGWGETEFKQSAQVGAQTMLKSGTTTVVDSSYSGQAAIAAAEAGLRAIVGLEIFGLRAEKEEDCWKGFLSKYDSIQQNPAVAQAIAAGMIELTVAPHAPYTVSPSLMQRANKWAQEHNKKILIHLAESVYETNWLQGSDETIDKFLRHVHGGDQSIIESRQWRQNNRSAVDHFHKHGLLSPSLIAAHCVHTDEQDAKLLAKSGCAVAICPRSNARLRNGAAPTMTLLDNGVPLGFGTDSAASNDDVDVLSEARFAWNLVRAMHPHFARTAEDAVNCLTLKAARIIGHADRLGSLDQGKLADIAVFYLPRLHESAMQKPYDLLLYGELKLSDLYVDGLKVANMGV